MNIPVILDVMYILDGRHTQLILIKNITITVLKPLNN